MPDIATSAVSEAGAFLDAMGLPVRLMADCDAVMVIVGRSWAILGPEEQDVFARLYQEAERRAEAWRKEHAGVSDDA